MDKPKKPDASDREPLERPSRRHPSSAPEGETGVNVRDDRHPEQKPTEPERSPAA